MIDLATVAQLEELRQADGLEKIAPEHRRFAGGCAARGVPGTWINNSVGMGLSGPVDPSELDELVKWFEEKQIEPRVELCPLVDPSATLGFAARQFVLHSWENVLFRELVASRKAGTVVDPPRELEVRIVDPNDDDMVREFSRVSMSGFFPPGTEPGEADYELSAKWVKQPMALGVVGVMDGMIVGAGTASLSPEVAYLSGLSVLPEYRRRGVQQALIAKRLDLAAERGMRIATIGSRPGAGTERNVRRMGFQLAYTKAILVRPGPGLVPNVG